MVFIFGVLAAFLLVINYQTFNAIKAGRTLVGFQNNMACFYLNFGRKYGFLTYRIIMALAVFIQLLLAMDEGAWIIFAAIFVGWIFEIRTHQLLRQTHFVATDIHGVPQANGHYLTPATVPQAGSNTQPA